MLKASLKPLKRLVNKARNDGITQVEIARQMGVTSQHFNKVLNGMANPSTGFLLEACKVFNCTMADVIEYVKIKGGDPK